MQNSERYGVCIGLGGQYPLTLSTQDQTRDLNGLKWPEGGVSLAIIPECAAP
jgi:hypothetical protein